MNPADVLDLTILTGLSGAGKSHAANILEDLGFFVIDNLPVSMLPQMVDHAASTPVPRRYAVVVDVRAGAFVDDLVRELEALRAQGARTQILFFDANDEVLIRRFEATRRPHPLSDGDTLVTGIERERGRLDRLRGEADLVIDTSDFSLPDLRARLRDLFLEEAAQTMHVNVVSFGYSHGLPLDADLVLDCRFLANPHWVETLRPLTGLDEPVREYVLAQDAAPVFLDQVAAMLTALLPGYAREGKSYLTISVGCTGGRHRSVAMTGEIARRLTDLGYAPSVTHRDLARD